MAGGKRRKCQVSEFSRKGRGITCWCSDFMQQIIPSLERGMKVLLN